MFVCLYPLASTQVQNAGNGNSQFFICLLHTIDYQSKTQLVSLPHVTLDFGTTKAYCSVPHLPYGAPCVSVPLRLLHRVPVGEESVVNFAHGRVAAPQQVQRLARLRVSLDTLLQAVDGERLTLGLVAQRVNTMVHPSWNRMRSRGVLSKYITLRMKILILRQTRLG